MTVKLGVVGLRGIGSRHCRSALALDNTTLVAGADTDPQRAAEAKQQFNLRYACTDADQLFADDQIDGVILALPNHLHAEMTIRALDAGKHVLIEKPITGDSQQVPAMIEARERSGKLLMVGMNQRFSPTQYALRELIRSGQLGEIYMAKSIWTRRTPNEGLWQRGNWFLSQQTSGGGPLLDLGIHQLDLVMFLLDFPKIASVTGICTTGIGKNEPAKMERDYQIEDLGLGIVRLENGSIIQIEASYFHNQPDVERQTCTLHGTHGYITDGEAMQINQGEATPLVYEPMSTAPTSCVDHFCRAIREDEELASTAEQGLLSLKIIEAMYASAQAGRDLVWSNATS